MTEQKQPILEVRGLTKSLGGRRILTDITLQVYPGEVYGFLGPNGSGKTTTIKVILGLLTLEQGDIRICSHDIRTDFEGAIANVGGIIENPEMYKYLTGRENLEQYARMYDDIPKERIDEVIKIVRLEERINDKISKYSLGMRQRLGIAQAILHKPKLLVLDEPTNGLDPAGIKELRDIFKHLAHEEDCAVFVSSHMLAELELMCDRVCVIDRGVILGSMTMEDIHASKNSDDLKYTVESDAPEKIIPVLTEYGCEAKQNGQSVTFRLSKEKAPELVARLCNDGIKIYGLSYESRTLEDAFMEITAREGGVGV